MDDRIRPCEKCNNSKICGRFAGNSRGDTDFIVYCENCETIQHQRPFKRDGSVITDPAGVPALTLWSWEDD